MPQQMWQNACCDGLWRGSPRACKCAPARKEQRSRWSLTMHEMMLRYQLHYGLTPIGPHRKLADGLLDAVTKTCERCDGEGLLDSRDARTWTFCLRCHGFGALPFPNAPDLKAVRAQVGARFPTAVLRNADNVGIGSLRHALENRTFLVHDLQTGAMICGTEDERHHGQSGE